MEALSEWLKPELVWFIIGLALLLLEFVAPGLILFFFGVGAWIVSIICFPFDISINIQLLIFIVSSVVLLALLRSRLKSTFLGRTVLQSASDEDMDGFVGERCVVVKEITGTIKGRVELHGTDWDAEADETISEGSAVEVISKKNITLKVKKLEEG